MTRRVIAALALAATLAAPVVAQSVARDSVASARQRASVTASPNAVRIRGTVTMVDERRSLVVVQDVTGGVVVIPAAPVRDLGAGDMVEVVGTAAITDRGATITDATVSGVGRAGLPAPQQLDQLHGRLAQNDGRVVVARGVVRRVREVRGSVEVTLQTRAGTITVIQPSGARPEATPVDAVVTVRGVLSQLLKNDGSLDRMEILAGLAAVHIDVQPVADPFAAPAIQYESLQATPPAEGLHRRVKMTGIVTRQRPGRSLYIRTATKPLFVETESTLSAMPGDVVEVAGFPDVDDYAPFLADAVFRRSRAGAKPPPVAATVGRLLDGSYDAELVQVEATYSGGEAGQLEFTLVLQQDTVIFNAHVLMNRVGSLPQRLNSGARVQLTGICSVLVDSDRTPRSFRLLLRDADDVVILAAGPARALGPRTPWWAWVSLVLALAAAGAAGVAYRTGRVKERTIRRQLARESALKARFDDMFERSSEIMIVHDRRGRVSTLNRAGEQATGYSRQELRMLDPNWTFGSDYLDAITRMLEEGADSTPRAFRSELVPRKGARIPIDVHAQVLVGDGQIVGVTAIARDLSERDRLENELRQAQKMEAVGRLATGIAHDFNNLITVLLGYSDELIEQVPAGSDWQRSATEIRRAAERASGLTQQLLSFSRRHEAMAQTVDLNMVIANMEDLIRRLLGPEIRLDFSLDPNLANIRADSAQIGQVIMNLVVNARDAMPKGGQLTIDTANVELGNQDLDVIPGPHVSLCVRDNGVGMAPDVRDRLFEPFFTTKESGQGTGLGLSLAQGIVRQCGGHVVVESQPGKGSAFHIYFPLIAGESEANVLPPLASPTRAAVKGEGVVLLAEDDRSVRRLVVSELGRRGFTVLDAEDGRAALDLFLQHKDRVDVLVTDVVMPRMNGTDLAKEVERIRPGMKILFISGHPERAGAGLDPVGVTNLLMKPFTADTLAARIKEMITGKPEADGWTA